MKIHTYSNTFKCSDLYREWNRTWQHRFILFGPLWFLSDVLLGEASLSLNQKAGFAFFFVLANRSFIHHVLLFGNDGSIKSCLMGTSLTLQWLRLWASRTARTSSIPGEGTKSPHAAWPKNLKTTGIWRLSVPVKLHPPFFTQVLNISNWQFCKPLRMLRSFYSILFLYYKHYCYHSRVG